MVPSSFNPRAGTDTHGSHPATSPNSPQPGPDAFPAEFWDKKTQNGPRCTGRIPLLHPGLVPLLTTLKHHLHEELPNLPAPAAVATGRDEITLLIFWLRFHIKFPPILGLLQGSQLPSTPFFVCTLSPSCFWERLLIHYYP